MAHQATQELLDWIDTLPEQEKTCALDIHQYISSKGIKPRMIKRGYVLFEYWLKGNRVLILRENSYRKTPLDIAIPYGLKGKPWDINPFIAACSGEFDKDELTKYIVTNVCCCDRGGR